MRVDGAVIILAATWAGYTANALSVVVSARALGAAGRGAYSAILVWAMTSASVADLSLGPALARSIAAGEPSDLLKRFLPRAYGAASIGAILLMVVLLNGFLSRSVPDPLGALIALSVAPALILSAWGVYFFQGLGHEIGYGLSRMLAPCLAMVFILSQAVRGLTLDGALAAFSLAYWLVGAWCAVYSWRYLAKLGHPFQAELAPPSQGRVGVEGARSLLSFGLRAHLGTVASIASARLDVLLLSVVVPLGALGNYSLAVSITTPIAMVGGALAASSFRRIGAGSPNELAVVGRAWRRFFLPTAVLTGVAVGAALLIPRVLGHEFDDAVVPTLILSLGAGGFGAIYLATTILQARGLPGTSSLLSLAAALLSASTLWLLVPGRGIVGAAVSSTLTYLVIGGVALPMTLRQHR